ncbi:general secretion pathway protein J [Comamonas sp. E6]|nr:general secretion pathway protein J [Comamonas sp. E6]
MQTHADKAGPGFATRLWHRGKYAKVGRWAALEPVMSQVDSFKQREQENEKSKHYRTQQVPQPGAETQS